jgi:hypothetical protein
MMVIRHPRSVILCAFAAVFLLAACPAFLSGYTVSSGGVDATTPGTGDKQGEADDKDVAEGEAQDSPTDEGAPTESSTMSRARERREHERLRSDLRRLLRHERQLHPRNGRHIMRTRWRSVCRLHGDGPLVSERGVRHHG